MKAEKELDQQYHIRAALVADLIGRYFGSSNRKKAQAVLREPGKWLLWTVNVMPALPPSRARNAVIHPLYWPYTLIIKLVIWFYLLGIMLLIRSWHRNRWTVKQVEEQCRASIKQYLEQKGCWIIDRIVDAKAVMRADSRIAKDPEYSNLDNLKIRTQETVFSVLLGTPLDNEYPQFTARTAKSPRWQKWLGLKPGDSPFRVLLKAFWKPFRNELRGDSTLSRDINTHFTATGIAREQGYNTGRLGDKTANHIFSEGIVHKEIKLKNDEGHTITDVIDGKSESFIDDVHRQLLLQNVYEVVTDPKDRAALHIYHAHFANGTTIEKEHKRNLRKYQGLGLRTPDSVRRRMSRIPKKYPQLRSLNPYR